MKNSIKVYLGTITLLLAFSVNVWALPYPVTTNEIITMKAASLSAYGGNYQAVNSAGVQFGTFCLEKNEYFWPNSQYKVSSIEEFAQNGGIGGAVNGKDELDLRTKLLYSHFLSKDLYVLAGISPANDSALQDAIWFIEQEIGAVTGDAKKLVDFAALHKNESLAYNVKAMNLEIFNDGHTEYGTLRQSQLVGAPVPEPSTFLLLGAGLLGAGLLRRRSRK